MNVSEEVTLVWTDDNFGNLNRIPVGDEVERSGGAGVYFHFQYVGAPRSWRWGNTVQSVRTWEQMRLAYERGAREIWLVNVGDVKPLVSKLIESHIACADSFQEIPTSHFMDMAYDMTKFTAPDSTSKWLAQFAGSNFYSGSSDKVGSLLTEFGILAGRRKWELYNPDGSPFAFSTLNYQESQTNLKRWDNLVSEAQEIYQELDPSAQVAYYETVLYPILSGYHIVRLYTYYDMAKQYKKQGRTSTNNIAARAHTAFDADYALTAQFQSMLNGRWDEMVDEPHIGMRDFGKGRGNAGKMPPVAYISDADTANMSAMGVMFEDRDTSLPGSAGTNQLLEINPYLQDEQARWLDIFARKNGTFEYIILINASFVSASYANGSITSPSPGTDIRSIISVDWNKAPPGNTNVGLTVTGAGAKVDLILPVNNVVASTSAKSAFIEADRVVSMEAAHYSTADTNSYIEIPAYGRTLSGIKRWPATAPSTSAPLGPKLTYNFYTFTSAEHANLTLHLGQTGNVDPTRPLKYAYSIDGGKAETVQPVADYPMGDHPTDWVTVVKDASRRSSNTVDLTRVGEHRLDLWLLEPEVVLTKIVLDLGGERVSYLGPPESHRGK